MSRFEAPQVCAAAAAEGAALGCSRQWRASAGESRSQLQVMISTRSHPLMMWPEAHYQSHRQKWVGR